MGTITIKATSQGDTVTILSEDTDKHRISDFQLRLLNISPQHLGIPEKNYDAVVKLPSVDFYKICKDLGSIGESLTIAVSMDSTVFSTKDVAERVSVTLKKKNGCRQKRYGSSDRFSKCRSKF